MSDYSGTVGSDIMLGTTESDRLFGLEGNDQLIALGADDWMFGGLGDDAYRVDSQQDLIFEFEGEGRDYVYSSVNLYLYANVEVLFLLEGSGAQYGVGNALNNHIVGNEIANLLIAGGGDDIVYGAGGGDTIFGEDGIDVLYGEQGHDHLFGGAAGDILNGGIGSDWLDGGGGNDILVAGDDFSVDTLIGGAGDDLVDQRSEQFSEGSLSYGGAGNDFYWVSQPDDLVFENPGEGDADTVRFDSVFSSPLGYYLFAEIENLIVTGNDAYGVGNELDNYILGGDGKQLLLGGAGNDHLEGWTGNDILYGQAGADTFVFGQSSGADRIGDFEDGIDKINLSNTGYNWTGISQAIGQNGADSFINLSNGNVIVLAGISSSQLDAGDFIFDQPSFIPSIWGLDYLAGS